MKAQTSTQHHPSITFHEVTQANWCDLERLFESRGGPKACWCLVWREPKRKGEKLALKEYVESSTPIGLLGYLDQEPVAWCSIAPRSSFRDSLAMVLPQDTKEVIWSITCFFIKRKYRGQGMLQALLSAAEEYAQAQGATMIEAYPVDPESPSYRFCGFRHSFERKGYEEVGRVGIRRHVLRRRLPKPRSHQ